jgi:hypothetical protein
VALEDTEINEDQMIVAREAILTRSRMIMKRIKLRGFMTKQRSKTLFFNDKSYKIISMHVLIIHHSISDRVSHGQAHTPHRDKLSNSM